MVFLTVHDLKLTDQAQNMLRRIRATKKAPEIEPHADTKNHKLNEYEEANNMDTTGMEESNYINASMIDRSLTKTAVIMDEAVTESTDYGLKLKMTVALDGISRIYRPNTDSIFNLQHAYGRDSKLWIGKKILFKTFKAKGKDIITVIPVQETAQQVA